MNIISWNNDLLTNLEEIDRQHYGFVQLINRLSPTLVSMGSEQSGNINQILGELADYGNEHFTAEEHLMMHHHVDSRVFDSHHNEHQNYMNQIQSFKKRAAQHTIIPADELLSFLGGWLIHHILGQDQCMARQVLAIINGLDPERAYREAGGYESAIVYSPHLDKSDIN